MKHALVTTTINIPHNLEAYCRDIAAHGRKDAAIVVAGDRKSPDGTASFCAGLAARYGVTVEFMGVREQEAFLSACPDYAKFLPWNCIQRRNVAILKAYADGAEVIYSIDDDNFLETHDYLGAHGELGQRRDLETVAGASGWFNICTYLQERNGRAIFCRGFSAAQRAAPDPTTTSARAPGRVVVNAGLWTGDPDVDAVTRLALAPDIVAARIDRHVALAIGTKSPFNSQNTAVLRDVIPAYCMMARVGRYDDIVPSYFVKRIADHLGDYVTFGPPILRQDRNQHDLWTDAANERVGYELIDRIVDWLYAIPLLARDYRSCLEELLPAFRARSEGAADLRPDQRAFLAAVAANYSAWLAAIARV